MLMKDSISAFLIFQRVTRMRSLYELKYSSREYAYGCKYERVYISYSLLCYKYA